MTETGVETRAPDALGELYDAHGAGLFSYACVLARSRAEAEDAVQETFARIAARAHRLDAVEDMKGYLYATLRNEVFRQRKRWRVWRARDEAAGTLRFEQASFAPGEGPTVNPEALSSALAGLPEEQREAVFLKIWQEMTFAEIGTLLGVPLDTAASRYRYALEKLSRTLQPLAEEVRHG